MNIEDFEIGDSVILDGEMCEVVDIYRSSKRLIVRTERDTRIVVNPEDLSI